MPLSRSEAVSSHLLSVGWSRPSTPLPLQEELRGSNCVCGLQRHGVEGYNHLYDDLRASQYLKWQDMIRLMGGCLSRQPDG